MIVTFDLDIAAMGLTPVFDAVAPQLWKHPKAQGLKAGLPPAVGDLTADERAKFVVSCWVLFRARDAANRVYGEAAAQTVEDNFS